MLNNSAELLKEIKKLQKENNLLGKRLAHIEDSRVQNTHDILTDIFENAGLGISLVDVHGHHLQVNTSFTKMLGYSKKEMLNKHFKEFTHPHDVKNDLKLFQQMIKGTKKSYKLDKRYIKKNGQIVWGKLTVTTINSKKDKTKYIIRIIENVTEQKEIEKDLAFERKLLQALMHYSPDSIYFKDISSKFIRVNLSKANKHGFKKEEDLIGKSDFDLYQDGHARDALKDEKEIIKSGKPIINKEERIDWRNGRVAWVSTTKMPLYDDDSKIIGTFGITRDISDRVKFEQGLRESEERYRTLFENSTDGILMLTNVFEDCNPAALQLFGAEKDEILKHHPADFSPALQPDGTDSLQSINKKISAALSGSPQNFYWQFKRKNGELFDVEVSLNPITIHSRKILQATVRDISEQINARKVESAIYKISEAAHTSEDIDKLYKRIHEIISELMIVRNFYIALYDEKKNVLSFPYFVDEYDPPQAPKPFGKGLTEYVMRKNEAVLIDAKKDLELRESGEVELIGAPQAIWLGIPLKLRGKTLGVMVVQDYENENAFGEAEKNLLMFVSDQITQAIERKKNAEAIKNYAEELIQSNKTKDKFFSILAHDLRNPFITILGFSDLLITDYNELTDEERLFYVEEMKKSAEISHNLLQNLLQWSRSQTGRIEFRPANVNLKNVILSNIEITKPTAERKQITLSTNVRDDIFVFADEDMINTVIRNLLTNALKFTNKSGEVQLVVKINDNFVETSVCDNGVGMDEEAMSKLFRLDFSLSQPGTDNEMGTGLGLILCKEFIEKNGGVINVQSQLGKGSKFSFKLPTTN